MQEEGGRSRLRLHGRWTVAEAAAQGPRLREAARAARGAVVVDAAGVEALDLTGAWFLRSLERQLRDAGARRRVGRPAPGPARIHRPRGSGAGQDSARGSRNRPQASPASSIISVAPSCRPRKARLDLLGFIGAVTAGYGRIFASLRRLRFPSIVRHVYETGLTAVPIVSLIAFLIAVIVAYIGAQQLRKFGGEIFVVDLVTVSVLRELGVLLTAIIVAGRSGSAFRGRDRRDEAE